MRQDRMFQFVSKLRRYVLFVPPSEAYRLPLVIGLLPLPVDPSLIDANARSKSESQLGYFVRYQNRSLVFQHRGSRSQRQQLRAGLDRKRIRKGPGFHAGRRAAAWNADNDPRRDRGRRVRFGCSTARAALSEARSRLSSLTSMKSFRTAPLKKSPRCVIRRRDASTR
jgi:hypothetical protein